MTLQQQFESGLSHHQAGRLAEAEALYREVLAQQPNHVGALHLLGMLSGQMGRNDIAVDLIRRAIALRPNLPELYNNLGIALKDTGQFDEAIAACHQAIALRPNYPEAHYNLGNALKEKGELDEAIAAFRRTIGLRPDFPEAHNNLGLALCDKGQVDEAIVSHSRAIALRSDSPEAYSNLGLALSAKGELDEAISAFRQAIALKSNYAKAHANLGIALKDKGQLEEAISVCRQAIILNPNFPEAHTNLGTALKEIGQVEESIAAYRKAIALKPNFPEAHSNLVFALHYAAAYNAREIAEEHRRWNRQHGEPLRKFIQPYSNDRDPNRCLRVGYVSPDFWEHPVGRFLLPLLKHHDHRQFEIFCYSNATRMDGITASLRSHADHWREIVGLNNDQVAGQVRADGIDILIDLSGHAGANRLLVFARKPAPVQVSYLGYPGTTGLSAIDYRLTDRFADPPDQTDGFHSEKLLRLPRTNWCFAAPEDDLPVQPPPALRRGYVTFGSFNNFAKVTDAMLRVWAEILRQVSGSRLLLKAAAFGSASARERVRGIFTAQGIEAGRLDLQSWQRDRESHLSLYGEMDIALDTFPYNGTTTTCDALWMGVPTITLAGQTHVSRVGLSLLSNIGLSETIATTTDEYIGLAVALAQDRDRLKTLRSGLRERMRISPLMDAEGFARDVEAAYRQMWRAWT